MNLFEQNLFIEGGKDMFSCSQTTKYLPPRTQNQESRLLPDPVMLPRQATKQPLTVVES